MCKKHCYWFILKMGCPFCTKYRFKLSPPSEKGAKFYSMIERKICIISFSVDCYSFLTNKYPYYEQENTRRTPVLTSQGVLPNKTKVQHKQRQWPLPVSQPFAFSHKKCKNWWCRKEWMDSCECVCVFVCVGVSVCVCV